MNWLFWILEFVKAIAWPLTIIVVLFQFRKPIENLLERIITVKRGDTEISFEQKKEEVTKDIVSANNQSDLVTAIAAWDVNPYTEDPATIVKTSWKRIESKIDNLIKMSAISYPSVSDAKGKIEWLEENKKISTKTAKSLYGVYQLRRLAIDSSEPNLDIEKARDFAILADAALYALTIDSESKS